MTSQDFGSHLFRGYNIGPVSYTHLDVYKRQALILIMQRSSFNVETIKFMLIIK